MAYDRLAWFVTVTFTKQPEIGSRFVQSHEPHKQHEQPFKQTY